MANGPYSQSQWFSLNTMSYSSLGGQTLTEYSPHPGGRWLEDGGHFDDMDSPVTGMLDDGQSQNQRQSTLYSPGTGLLDDGQSQSQRQSTLYSPGTGLLDEGQDNRQSVLSAWRSSAIWAAETMIAMNLDDDAETIRQSVIWGGEFYGNRHLSTQTLAFTAPSPTRASFGRLPPTWEEIYGRADSSHTEESGQTVDPLIPVKRKPVPVRPPKAPEEKVDPDLVTWSGPNDPENPKNFSAKKKWGILAAISTITLLSPFTSSIMAPGLPEISKDLNIKSEVEGTVSLSIYILGFALGPLFLAPLSEVYGRVIILQPSMLFFLLFNFACGFAKNGPALIILRFFSGVGGSAPLVVGTGVISDCFKPAERGRAVSIWGLGPLLGPALGPLIGAFIVYGTTWRWIFWSVSIADIVIQLLALFLLPETYAGTLLKRRMNKLRQTTGNLALHVGKENDKSLRESLKIALSRPFRMLGTQPIIQLVALYMAYIFGLFYLLLTSFPNVWEGIYGESVEIAGLNYLSLGIGYVIGAQFNGYLNDHIYKYLKSRNKGKAIPEFRLPLILVGSILMPIGLFWYGWSARPSVHWIVPNLGMAVFAAGSVLCLQCMQTYIIDCYTRFAASGIAAAVVLRSLAGFSFPLFSPALYDHLGMGWGTSVLGFLCIFVGIPAPILFWKYGKRLRERSAYSAG